MNISVIDGSNYFKGLLLLVRKDMKVSDSEIQLMMRIGKKLGFEQEFCENAIRNVLENKYLVEAVPKFSTKELEIKFIKDGLALAFSDQEIHPSEEEWLKMAAGKYGLSLEWFRVEYEKASHNQELPEKLEVDDLAVEYSMGGNR